MRATEFINEGWSQKYKSSINCSHPKGFSQKAHCAGKKKHNESLDMEMVCEDCGMCQTHGNLNEIKKGQKDSNGFTSCWPGKHAEGTKKGKHGKPVRNCVPNEGMFEEAVDPNKLLASVTVDGEFKEFDLTPFIVKNNWVGTPKQVIDQADKWLSDFFRQRQSAYSNLKITYKGMVMNANQVGDVGAQDSFEGLTPDEQFNIIEEMVEQLALEHGVDPEVIWEDFDSVDDNELLESAAWHRSAGKSKKGGLNAKGVASYRREHPGSKLQMAVTTKPSKLKPGSKAAKRRKSFCARMGGVKGPMKKPNGKPTRKALALRKWNC
jgi:hypothetical protein